MVLPFLNGFVIFRNSMQLIPNYFLLVLFSVVINVSSAQQSARFHSLCNQACEALEYGMVDHAYVLLTEAFAIPIPPKAADYLNMAKCYSQQNEVDSTEKYIYLAMERNPKIRGIVRIHSLWFEPVVGTMKWAEILEKTRGPVGLSAEAQRVVDELHTIDSLNIWFYRKFRAEADSGKSVDTVALHASWDSSFHEALKNAPKLDSILLSLPDSLLIHPAVEEIFLILDNLLRTDYWKPRQQMYEELIKRGFVTPDILAPVYIKEKFGDKPMYEVFNKSSEHATFFDEYGLIANLYTHSYRVLNLWSYDDRDN